GEAQCRTESAKCISPSSGSAPVILLPADAWTGHSTATAMEQGELELFYQPQVALSDRRKFGAEALLRWRHPERGLLSPGALLPVLESGPLAAIVGDWTIRTACAFAAGARRNGSV